MAELRLKVNAVESEDDLCLYRIEPFFPHTSLAWVDGEKDKVSRPPCARTFGKDWRSSKVPLRPVG